MLRWGIPGNKTIALEIFKWEQLLKVWSTRGERGGTMVLEIYKWSRSVGVSLPLIGQSVKTSTRISQNLKWVLRISQSLTQVPGSVTFPTQVVLISNISDSSGLDQSESQ